MFRQIRISADNQDWQRLLWSPNSDSPPVDYRLTTVTYGTASAPYLAIRTLLQLAQDEESKFPLAAHCLRFNTYVDDIFTGADNLELAIQKRQELIELLGTAGISLDKWAANDCDLPPLSSSNSDQPIDLDKSVKTLGIPDNLTRTLTKRAILFTISKLFDPLGWLAPISITAKIIMQDLWIVKCGWDDTLLIDIRERWLDYCKSLALIPTIKIRRWFGTYSSSVIQIHGFCDASSRAYAAVVYLRLEIEDNSCPVVLLAAKTKVAPVKTISIPNLELCGAVLLVKLIRYLQNSKFLKNLPVFARSDSQIVLQYLKKHPCHWKTFITNRVSFVQTELPTAIWSHVSTKENPTDLTTRGVKPSDLAKSQLWWCGPNWLAKSSKNWPQSSEILQDFHNKTKAENKAKPAELDILSRFSSLDRLIRIVTRLLRPIILHRNRKNGLDTLPDFLTALELNHAHVVIIKMVQSSAFPQEIELLKAGKPLMKRLF